MGLSVIGQLIVVAGDVHGHVCLEDRQPAVVDDKGHVLEVVVVIGEVPLVQTHVVGARVGFFQVVAAVEDDLTLVEQRAVAVQVVAADAVGISVVERFFRVTADVHSHGGRVDCQPAVGDFKGHVLEVAVAVVEIPRTQTHVVVACVGFIHAGDAVE